MPVQPTTNIASGDNRLVSGTKKKTWNKNFPLIARFVLAEFIQNFSPATGALVGVYNTVGEEAFITGVTVQINIALVANGKPPLTEKEVKDFMNSVGGIDKVVNALEQGSTLFLAPANDYLYTFKNSTLNIPAGEYSEGAIWRSDGQTYILQPSREWIASVDWIAGVPNLSWLGDWYEFDETDSSFDLTSIVRTTDYGISGRSSTFVPPPANENSTPQGKKSFFPVFAAAAGFLVGGPIGAGIGFLAANFLKD
jgi:hypothetical protein